MYNNFLAKQNQPDNYHSLINNMLPTNEYHYIVNTIVTLCSIKGILLLVHSSQLLFQAPFQHAILISLSLRSHQHTLLYPMMVVIW